MGKQLFAQYDKDKNGVIDRSELVSLLLDLKIPMRSLNDQQKMLEMLREAHQQAVDAGLEADEAFHSVTHPHVTFWMLVYVLRMLCNMAEEKEVAYEEEAIRETGFAQPEV